MDQPGQVLIRDCWSRLVGAGCNPLKTQSSRTAQFERLPAGGMNVCDAPGGGTWIAYGVYHDAERMRKVEFVPTPESQGGALARRVSPLALRQFVHLDQRLARAAVRPRYLNRVAGAGVERDNHRGIP